MRDLTNSSKYRKPFSWVRSLLDTNDCQSQDTNLQTTMFHLFWCQWDIYCWSPSEDTGEQLRSYRRDFRPKYEESPNSPVMKKQLLLFWMFTFTVLKNCSKIEVPKPIKTTLDKATIRRREVLELGRLCVVMGSWGTSVSPLTGDGTQADLEGHVHSCFCSH